MDLPYTERRERLRRARARRRALAACPTTSSATASSCWPRPSEQGLEGVVAKRLDSPYEPGRRSARWLKVKNTRAPGARDRRLDAGRGQAPRPHRRAAARRARRRRRAALRRARRHRLHRGRARRLAELLRAARREDSPFAPGGPKLPRGARLRRARARGRGRVPRVDARRACCARRPTRGCATTSPPTLVVREDGRSADAVGRGRRPRGQALQPRQGPLSRGRLHQARPDRLLPAIAPAVLPHLGAAR